MRSMHRFIYFFSIYLLFPIGLCYSDTLDIYQDTVIEASDNYEYTTFNVHSIPPNTTTLTMMSEQGYGIKVNTYESSIFDMRDGRVYGIEAYDTSRIRIENTYTSIQSFACYDSSEIEIFGGSYAYSIYFRQNSSGSVYGGSLTGLDLHNTSHVDVYGGRMAVFQTRDFTTFNLYDGIIENTIYTDDDSILNIYGCTYQGTLATRLIASHNSTVNIYGYDFIYDPDGGSYGYGHLSGHFLDGRSINFDLWEDTYLHINLIPEPTALSLLALGAMLAGRKRRM